MARHLSQSFITTRRKLNYTALSMAQIPPTTLKIAMRSTPKESRRKERQDRDHLLISLPIVVETTLRGTATTIQEKASIQVIEAGIEAPIAVNQAEILFRAQGIGLEIGIAVTARGDMIALLHRISLQTDPTAPQRHTRRHT
jgi:hypothetical protein